MTQQAQYDSKSLQSFWKAQVHDEGLVLIAVKWTAAAPATGQINSVARGKAHQTKGAIFFTTGRSQPALYSEFQGSHEYILRFCVKQTNANLDGLGVNNGRLGLIS